MTAHANTSPTESKTALVVGASGITGSALVDRLSRDGWEVLALSRRATSTDAVRGIAADLRDPESLRTALAAERPTHVFFTAWQRQATEAENIAVNGAMVRDLLAALDHAPLEHVALVTGLKHYLGPFEAYAAGEMPDTPFREESERLDTPNFYYAQEDELFAASATQGFTWSVHRSHTVIGHAVGNAMNMGLTIAVQATVAKHLGLPFVFPGSAAQWNGLTDMTDAGVLADQMVWASTDPAGHNEAFNIVNGDVFRWRWMWPRLAELLDVPAEQVVGFDGEARPLEVQMAEHVQHWPAIAEQHGLIESDISRLASWWHTDADLGREMEVVTDMGKSRAAGFLSFRRTDQAFADLFDRYRADRLIP
ncbi:MAG: SDR family oxidoreductase [Mycetocola sp.]